MKAPPLFPAEVLQRVLRLARFDGLSVLVVAGIFALISARLGDYLGAVVGLLVAGAGAIELHGASLLKHRQPRGMDWLVRSQLILLITVLAYCALRLLHPDLAPLRATVNEDVKAQLEVLGWSVDQFLGTVYRLTYLAVSLATFAYQGGMAVYYWRRRATVVRALTGQ